MALHTQGNRLNLAEPELGVLSTQCLDRRIPDKQNLIEEIAAWEHELATLTAPRQTGNSRPNCPHQTQAAPIPFNLGEGVANHIDPRVRGDLRGSL